jgi:hypothetical protein
MFAGLQLQECVIPLIDDSETAASKRVDRMRLIGSLPAISAGTRRVKN